MVEDISINRQPLPFDAIYFISPQEQSVAYIVNDFSKPERSVQYPRVHIFTTGQLDDNLLKMIQDNSVLAARIKTLKELHVDWLSPEAQTFHLDSPHSLSTLYSESDQSSPEIAEFDICRRLRSLCLSIGQYPIMRAARTSVATRIATTLQDMLDSLPKAYKPLLKSQSSSNFTLLILDRSFDPVSPLLHEFTYQAMIQDLISGEHLQDNCYTYEVLTENTDKKKGDGKKTKQVLLDETDFLWPKMRHMHIADSITWIIKSFNNFVKTNKIANLQQKQGESKSGVAGLKQINQAMKEMPQYQEMFSKYSLHIRLANECMNIYKNRELANIAMTEQDMAMGTDADGKAVKKGNVMTEVRKYLKDGSIRSDDKLRLFLLFLWWANSNSIKDKDLDEMINVAEFDAKEKQAIQHAKVFGIGAGSKAVQLNLTKPDEKSSKKKSAKKSKEDSEDVPYAVSRWQPVLKEVIRNLSTDSLDTKDFPYLGKSAPLRSGGEGSSGDNKQRAKSLKSKGKERKDTWADEKEVVGAEAKSKKLPEDAPRVIVFIAGGATYSEVRCAYEAREELELDVAVGATSLITPGDFLSELKNLGGGGGGGGSSSKQAGSKKPAKEESEEEESNGESD